MQLDGNVLDAANNRGADAVAILTLNSGTDMMPGPLGSVLSGGHARLWELHIKIICVVVLLFKSVVAVIHAWLAIPWTWLVFKLNC